MYVIRNNGRKLVKNLGRLQLEIDAEKAFTTVDMAVVDAFKNLPDVTITERPAAPGEKPTVGASAVGVPKEEAKS